MTSCCCTTLLGQLRRCESCGFACAKCKITPLCATNTMISIMQFAMGMRLSLSLGCEGHVLFVTPRCPEFQSRRCVQSGTILTTCVHMLPGSPVHHATS